MLVPVILPLWDPIGRGACVRDFIGPFSCSCFRVGGGIVTVGVRLGARVVCLAVCRVVGFGVFVVGVFVVMVVGGGLCRNCIACFHAGIN